MKCIPPPVPAKHVRVGMCGNIPILVRNLPEHEKERLAARRGELLAMHPLKLACYAQKAGVGISGHYQPEVIVNEILYEENLLPDLEYENEDGEKVKFERDWFGDIVPPELMNEGEAVEWMITEYSSVDELRQSIKATMTKVRLEAPHRYEVCALIMMSSPDQDPILYSTAKTILESHRPPQVVLQFEFWSVIFMAKVVIAKVILQHQLAKIKGILDSVVSASTKTPANPKKTSKKTSTKTSTKTAPKKTPRKTTKTDPSKTPRKTAPTKTVKKASKKPATTDPMAYLLEAAESAKASLERNL